MITKTYTRNFCCSSLYATQGILCSNSTRMFPQRVSQIPAAAARRVCGGKAQILDSKCVSDLWHICMNEECVARASRLALSLLNIHASEPPHREKRKLTGCRHFCALVMPKLSFACVRGCWRWQIRRAMQTIAWHWLGWTASVSLTRLHFSCVTSRPNCHEVSRRFSFWSKLLALFISG